MSDTNDYGIQSIPPRYDQYNRYHVHTSEGYKRTVEDIDRKTREAADTEYITEEQKRLESEEVKRWEETNRENEKRILDEIRKKEAEIALQKADVSEYETDEENRPGLNVNLLA